MDQVEVNQIIMDSDAPPGCKCNEIEKEFVILKGSIKKLILDIREQMNSSENPFSNIQMLQMPPPAPVIKEDPIEFEVPKDDGEEKLAEAKARAQADQQAAKEKTMAQEKKTDNGIVCPHSARADASHNYCPLSAKGNSLESSCPLAMRARTTDRSCPASTNYCDMHTNGHLQPYSCESRGRETRSTGNTPYCSYPAHSGDRHTCATCGRPMSPAYGVHQRDWPYPYPPYHQRNWQERPGYGMYQESPRQPAYGRRPFFYDHPEAEPAQYGNPYGSAYPDEIEEDPRYGPQNVTRRRMPGALPEYYQYRDDGYYYEPETYPYRQPVDSGYEPEYYRPAPAVRRRPRAPGLTDDRYYELSPEEPREPARYRSAPRRRRTPSQPAPEFDPVDEFEMTEPIPEIDMLPDEPEREEEPLRIRKRTRAAGILPEPLRPDLVEQPNPKPRRSRAIKHRS